MIQEDKAKQDLLLMTMLHTQIAKERCSAAMQDAYSC